MAAYRHSFFAAPGESFVAVATARAGNVIGGGDWSSDRLIPDTVRAFRAGKPVEIRNPNSIRPWQHVLDPLLDVVLELIFAAEEFRAGDDLAIHASDNFFDDLSRTETGQTCHDDDYQKNFFHIYLWAAWTGGRKPFGYFTTSGSSHAARA